MAYVYRSRAVHGTIFSTGGKFAHLHRNETQLTTPYLITAISAVLGAITAIRGLNTLKIAAPKRSSSTRDCNIGDSNFKVHMY